MKSKELEAESMLEKTENRAFGASFLGTPSSRPSGSDPVNQTSTRQLMISRTCLAPMLSLGLNKHERTTQRRSQMRNITLRSKLEPGKICGFLFCVGVATMAAAQTPAPVNAFLGHGKTDFIPAFSSPGRITSSNIFQSAAGNIGIGTTAPIVPLHVFSNNPIGPDGYGPITPWIENRADNAQGSIYAVASSPVGGTAVNGEAYFGTGTGVNGQENGSGVTGSTSNPTGFATGVTGNATASTGPAVAVFGQNYSPDGLAGLFINRAAGNILEGRINAVDLTVFRVDGTGRVFADGGFQRSGADFAESMAVVGDRSRYAAGNLLVIDASSNRHVGLSQQPYSTMVAGIYSTKPGILGTTGTIDAPANRDEIPLAVVGIVPCKVSAENGPIAARGLLVTSATPGYAMRGTERRRMLGAVVGKALEPLPREKGIIQVLVTLQ